MSIREAVGRLAVQERRARTGSFEPEEDAHERRLAAAVGACDGDELAFAECEVDVLEHVLTGPVPERDVAQLDG